MLLLSKLYFIIKIFCIKSNAIIIFILFILFFITHSFPWFLTMWQAIATAMKQGSNSGLRFMWFNEYKKRVTNDGNTSMSPLMALFGGMSAGCFSTLGNNPFDVVKASY